MKKLNLYNNLNMLNCNVNFQGIIGVKKVAFTLAEVLITLGIIGVVAAMTLPILITNYKHQVLKTQFKKAYSVLSQAVTMANAENGDFYDAIQIGSNEGANKVLKPELMKQMQVVKDYGKTGYIANFSKLYLTRNSDDKLSEIWGNLGQFMLKDGALVFTECSTNCFYVHVLVDINGPIKKPNRAGHDLFDFQINDKNQLVPASLFGTACNNVGSDLYGLDCTQQALSDDDYFKKLP